MKIKSISEAYSMQPNKLQVCTWEGKQTKFIKSVVDRADIPIGDFHTHTPECIERIEEAFSENGKWFLCYNFKNKIIHQWQADDCNVEYFPED
jgi:hypothetical protein